MEPVLYVSQIRANRENPPAFPTVADALRAADAIDGPVTVCVREGVYREKLEIKRPNLTLVGEGRVCITWDDYAGKRMENGETYGTFRSYTVFVDTHDFTAKNIIFENSAGPVGQALALYADGDRLVFDRCAFLGYQDTVFTGPLPPKEFIPGGFRGPKEFAPRIVGRQYYKDCYISGTVDFIFGSAVAYFENCEIVSRRGGYVTAASTPQGQKYGYVFADCRLVPAPEGEGEETCPNGSVFLGRPWREYAKTVFLRCELGKQIAKAGWDDWKKPDAHDTVFYAEYQSRGAGAARNQEDRASFSRQLTGDKAARYTRERVLGGEDGWDPHRQEENDAES